VASVERELEALPFVREAVVTGVEVAGYDGRVGLAVLVAEPDFDVAGLAALTERLPRSAWPRFVRLVAELNRTASLKLKRSSFASDGVDPALVGSELWALVEGRYRRLDAQTYRDIVSGKLRL